jgi:hypothetical protein
MRPVALVVFSAALLGLTGVQAATRSGDIADTTPVTKMQTGVTQVAESNSKSPNKLGDKYLDGKAGGFYGIGGSEPHVKYFKSRMKKIPPCCGSSH